MKTSAKTHTRRPTVRFDPTDPALIADPHTAFAHLRSTTPFVWSQAGFWIATRHEDVRSVIIDRKNFGQGDFTRNIQLYYGDDFDVFAHSSYRWLSEVFVYQDPPRHTRIRGLVSKALTAKRVREMRPDIEAITHRLLDRFADRREMELIHDFAYRLPTLVMCHMLGIDEQEADDLLLDQLNQAIADSFLVLEMRPLNGDELALANRQIDFLEAFFQSIFERRRAQPRDDLATALLDAREGDSQLTEREMVTVAIALFGAGFETTAHMIGNGILTLSQNPEQWTKLVSYPDMATSATEEILRYESSLIATYRTAFNDVEVGGQRIKAGERVLALLAAGNRDPGVFPQPDVFDISRQGAHHLAFGGGIHFCVGAELARLEGDVAFRALAERLPNLRTDTSKPLWRPGFMFRGLEQLNISW
ncbi:MAG: cytochrome P450 [Haliea sp.]|jgi:cytochrome P450|nr:cytochrome P450 [Haliea sp.]